MASRRPQSLGQLRAWSQFREVFTFSKHSPYPLALSDHAQALRARNRVPISAIEESLHVGSRADSQ